MSAGLIRSLIYISPYFPMPPGIGIAGVQLQTDPAQSPTPSTIKDPVLVFRLRLASDTQAVIGISATSGAGTSVTSAFFQPDFPLSSSESYMIDIIWIPIPDSSDPDINWDNAVASAPVTAAQVGITATSFNGTSLSAELAYKNSGIQVGAQVNVFSLTSSGVFVKVGSNQTADNYVTVPVNNPGYPKAYFFSAQAAVPTTNAGGAASFSAPFSLGQPTLIGGYTGVPPSVTSLLSADYDNTRLILNWTLDTVLNCVNANSSLIRILSGSQLLAEFSGGTSMAIVTADVYQQPNITVEVSAVANVSSGVPFSFSLITQAPVISNVFADQNIETITANVTQVTAGPNVQAFLMDGETQLAGPVWAENGVVSFDYSSSPYIVSNRVGLSIVARGTSSDQPIVGPRSQPAVLLATAPSLISALIFTDPADSSKWRIDVEWERLPDQADIVARYQVSIMQAGDALTQISTLSTNLSLSVNKSAVDTTKIQSVELSASSVTGGNSPTGIFNLPFVAPQLTSVTTTQSQIAASWNPVNSPGNTPVGYRMVVLSNGTPVSIGPATTAVKGVLPLIDIDLQTEEDILVMVGVMFGPASLLPDASMPAGTGAVPILSSPVINPVATAPFTNLATLNWTVIEGAESYIISFAQGEPQTSTTNSLTLSQTISLVPPVTYTIQAQEVSNGVTITGPPSDPGTIPSGPAIVPSVRFDGNNVYAEWEAVPDAAGYTLSVFDNSTPPNQIYTAVVGDTSTSFTVVPVSDAIYNLYVQPVMSAGTGFAGVAVPLFSAGVYLSQQPASMAYPYIYIAGQMSDLGNTDAAPPSQSFTLYLPELGTVAGALGNDPITVAPFTIQPSGQTNLPYQLTISADASVWPFTTSPVRATLQSAYISFLKNIETPSAGNLTGASPYGIAFVQTAIANMLPQTFAEQLWYSFGFSTDSTVGAGYIDLRPGMILRVHTNDYISISQNRLPSWLNGFSNAGSMDFEIGSYLSNSNWQVGFNAFLSVLSAQGALVVNAPATSVNSVQAGVAGAADLYFAQFLQPYYRLYFPTSVSDAWDIGSNSTEKNFTLVAAGSYAGLQSTTVSGSGNPTAYFRGRATAEVLIKVEINNNERLIPVGSTLGNLLEQTGVYPYTFEPLLTGIRLYRTVFTAAMGSDPAVTLPSQIEVHLDWNGFMTYATGTGWNALSVPLLPGDRIFTNKQMIP